MKQKKQSAAWGRKIHVTTYALRIVRGKENFQFLYEQKAKSLVWKRNGNAI